MSEDVSAAPRAQNADPIGDYTAHLAHDLNNVFSVVIGSLGIVLDEYADRPLDDEAITLVEDAVSAGREGALLIESLLAAAGRQALRRGPVDVTETLASIEALLAQTTASTIAVEVDPGADAGSAWADPDRLRRSVLALATNACEAMPDGGTLRLAARRVLDGPAGVAIEVTDSGVGMTDDVLAMAREPFFTTRHPRRGRGLGLSIADGFARQSGGALTIESTPGAGTTATLVLPGEG